MFALLLARKKEIESIRFEPKSNAETKTKTMIAINCLTRQIDEQTHGQTDMTFFLLIGGIIFFPWQEDNEDSGTFHNIDELRRIQQKEVLFFLPRNVRTRVFYSHVCTYRLSSGRQWLFLQLFQEKPTEDCCGWSRPKLHGTDRYAQYTHTYESLYATCWVTFISFSVLRPASYNQGSGGLI